MDGQLPEDGAQVYDQLPDLPEDGGRTDGQLRQSRPEQNIEKLRIK